MTRHRFSAVVSSSTFILIAWIVGCDYRSASNQPTQIERKTTNRSTTAENTSKPPSDIANRSAPYAFYTVGHYDPTRNPAADLTATVARAQKENKNILLQVGGEWCIWCKRMSHYMETEAPITEMLEKNFLVMKVNYSPEQENTDFLSNFPKAMGYPHLFVLSSNGQLLHSQRTDALERGEGYSRDAFLKFLSDWRPKS